MHREDNTKPAAAYYSPRDEDFHGQPATLPADFKITAAAPPPDPDFKASGGRFVKGFDPRRHKFTREECSRGFWTAIAVWGVGMGEKLHAAGRWPNYRRA